MQNILVEFFLRHQNNVNLVLHVIGIPAVIAGIAFACMKKWKPGLILIFTGYFLQYSGHQFFEHNRMGEWELILALVTRLSGK